VLVLARDATTTTTTTTRARVDDASDATSSVAVGDAHAR
jgi:hypothetical protein